MLIWRLYSYFRDLPVSLPGRPTAYSLQPTGYCLQAYLVQRLTVQRRAWQRHAGTISKLIFHNFLDTPLPPYSEYPGYAPGSNRIVYQIFSSYA